MKLQNGSVDQTKSRSTDPDERPVPLSHHSRSSFPHQSMDLSGPLTLTASTMSRCRRGRSSSVPSLTASNWTRGLSRQRLRSDEINVDGQNNGNGACCLCASWLAEASWKWGVRQTTGRRCPRGFSSPRRSSKNKRPSPADSSEVFSGSLPHRLTQA